MIHDFKPDMKVSFISDDGTVKSGIIVAVHDFATVAIIRTDDGTVQKIPYECIFVEKTIKHKEPPREDVRTICKEDFIAALHKVTSAENMIGAEHVADVDSATLGIHSLAIFLAGMTIVHKLYDETDEITIDEDDLVMFIIKHCTPSELAVCTDMKPDALVMLSLECSLIIPKVIPILFGDSENEFCEVE